MSDQQQPHAPKPGGGKNVQPTYRNPERQPGAPLSPAQAEHVEKQQPPQPRDDDAARRERREHEGR